MKSFYPVIKAVAGSIGVGVKKGVAYSPSFGVQPSVLAEVYEKEGWSLDVGITKGHLLAGASRDIYSDKIDINAGATINRDRKMSYYTGVSFRF